MKNEIAQNLEQRFMAIDWLTASIPIEMDVEECITEVLQLDYRDFSFEDGGIARSYRYERTAKFGDIAVYYSTPEGIENGFNKGLAVNISGQGCRQYEMYKWQDDSYWTWYDTIGNINHYQANFTRIDMAMDVINSIYTWQFVLKKIYEKTLVYRGTVMRQNKINSRTGEDYHASIYIGDKPQQLNIYDKKGERFDRAKIEYDVENWTRWELRLSGDKAKIAVEEILGGRKLSDLFCGILKAHYRFVTLTGDKNRSRRSNAQWWERFLLEAQETPLYLQKDKPTLKRKENWLEKHGPDKAELMLYLKDFFVYGADKSLDRLLKRLQIQKLNMTDRDIQMIVQGIVEEMRIAGVVGRYGNTIKTGQVVQQIQEMLNMHE